MKNRLSKQREFLRRAVLNGRVPQAFIFSGPDSQEKKEAALNLLLEANQGRQLRYPDLIVISPEGREISIARIRDLKKELSLSCQIAAFKAVIIEKAHLLNRFAQNCLLKVLEEPPGKTHFILITKYPDLLLPTIRSRCALLKFYPKEPLPLERVSEIEQLLKQDLAARFAFAKKEEDLDGFLYYFLKYLRGLLLDKLDNQQSVKYSFQHLKELIEETESLLLLFSTSNVNKRLAFENLLLEI